MQEEFFPGLEGVAYCHCRSRCPDFLEYLLHADDFEFKSEHARELFEKDVNVDRSVPLVLSDEMFYAPLAWNGDVHRRRGCERLADVFPGAHVAIVLRNQRDLLESLYREFIKNGGTSPWPRFLGSQIAPGYLHYNPYVAYLFDLFGAGKVSVFLYEDFVAGAEAYLDSWCDALGVARTGWDRGIASVYSNPGISPGLLAVLRIVNRVVANRRHPELVLPRGAHALVRAAFLRCSNWFKGSSRRLCPDTDALQRLLESCRDGNRELSELLDRDLRDLGYRC